MTAPTRSRSKAEERFARLTERELERKKERDKALKVSDEKVTRLKALRLAKEQADREAAAAAKKKPSSKASGSARKDHVADHADAAD